MAMVTALSVSVALIRLLLSLSTSLWKFVTYATAPTNVTSIVQRMPKLILRSTAQATAGTGVVWVRVMSACVEGFQAGVEDADVAARGGSKRHVQLQRQVSGVCLRDRWVVDIPVPELAAVVA